MRFLVPLFVVLAVAAFHSALSASLESAEKEEEVTQYDGLTQLQKIDQMEFEAVQKAKAAEMNVTEDQSDETRYLEAVKDGSVEEHGEGESESTAKGAANSNGAVQEESESGSSEDTEGRQRRNEKKDTFSKKMQTLFGEHKETVTESSLDEASQESTPHQDA